MSRLSLLGGGLATPGAETPAFAPSDISGMVFDHDCDLIPGSDGDTIASHTFEVEFSQSTSGKRPVLKKAANGINGHNVLRFSGAQAWRSTAAIDLTAVNDISIFCVAKITAAASTRILYEISPDPNTNAGSCNINLGATNIATAALKGNASFHTCASAASVAGAAVSLSALHDFGLASNEAAMYTDGVLGSQGTASDNSGNFGNYVFFVGARNEGSLYITADVARIILYNRKVSDEERGQIEAYLSDRYGLGF